MALHVTSDKELIQVAQGQMVEVCTTVFDDTYSLAGRVVRFNPSFYCGDTLPTDKAFEAVYPGAGNVVQMTQSSAANNSNYSASLRGIDNFTFEVCYTFFAIPSQGGYIPQFPIDNTTFCESESIDGIMCLYFEVGSHSVVNGFPFKMTDWCSEQMTTNFYNSFIPTDGFTAGQDLQVELLLNGEVDNNFFVGFIGNNSPTNSTDLVNAIGLDYAQVQGGGITTVADSNGIAFDNNCFLNGSGFVQGGIGGQSSSTITLDGSCLVSGSDATIYAVYRDGEGIWRSCKVTIPESIPAKEIIYGPINITVTDEFGVTAQGDVISGISECLPVTVCFQMDKSDYNQKAQDAGFSGDFDSSFVTIKSASTGSFDLSTGKYTTIVAPNGFTGSRDISVTYCFKIDDCEQEITKVLTLNFSAFESEPIVNFSDEDGEVSSLCVEFPKTITAEIQGIDEGLECIAYSNLNGGAYGQEIVGQDLTLDTSALSTGDEVCVKLICGEGAEEEPCICPECESISNIELTYMFGTDGNGDQTVTITAFSSEGLPLTLTYSNDIDNIVINGQGTGQSAIIVPYGTISSAIGGFLEIETETENGCTYSGSSFLINFTLPFILLSPVTATIPGCECPPETENFGDCMNSFQFEFVCDEATGEVTVSTVDTFSSVVQEDQMYYQLDSSIPFPYFGSTIQTNGQVLITRHIVFTGDCPDIYARQVIECRIEQDQCSNRRSVFIAQKQGLEACYYSILTTNNFSSDVLEDIAILCRNGCEIYNGPLSNFFSADYYFELGDIYEFKTIVRFEGDCPDLTTYHKGECREIPASELAECDYSAFSMNIIHDEEAGSFSIEYLGPTDTLEVDDRKFCLNDSKELTYNKPVNGSGLFSAKWTIKFANCPAFVIEDYESFAADICCEEDEEPVPDNTACARLYNSGRVINGVFSGGFIPDSPWVNASSDGLGYALQFKLVKDGIASTVVLVVPDHTDPNVGQMIMDALNGLCPDTLSLSTFHFNITHPTDAVFNLRVCRGGLGPFGSISWFVNPGDTVYEYTNENDLLLLEDFITVLGPNGQNSRSGGHYGACQNE